MIEQRGRELARSALAVALVLGSCAPGAGTGAPGQTAEAGSRSGPSAAFHPAPAPTPSMATPEPIAVPPSAAVTPQASADLREQMLALKLGPRAQGARGTCSIFTTCAAIEFALARASGEPRRLSPEFVNWAASQVIGRPSDGNFFHNALAGFERFGVCGEEALTYREPFDPDLAPSPAALDEAAALRESARAALAVHWIVPWDAGRFGVTDEQMREIRAVLARGYPVAAGSGHSRLLVGYRDDPAREGGGVFLTEDSALARFDEVTYDFVEKQVADVFWIEGAAPTQLAPQPGRWS